jgi:hypothetical protein
VAHINGYTRLPEAIRETTRAAARTKAQQAARRYAQLLAAEAGIAARAQLPTVARLVFRLSEDMFGPSATLVAAYGNTGRVQWHVDLDDEWPDESLVSDHLAAAAHWCPDIFPATDDGDTYQLDLDA